MILSQCFLKNLIIKKVAIIEVTAKKGETNSANDLLSIKNMGDQINKLINSRVAKVPAILSARLAGSAGFALGESFFEVDCNLYQFFLQY